MLENIVVFAKKKDGTIEAKEGNHGRWSGWKSWGKPPTPGGAMYSPTSCSWGGKRLDLFVCGSDSQLWHKWVDDDGVIHEWENLGGYLLSGPAATALMAKGRIDVFVKGSDLSMHVNTLIEGHTDHGKWSGWNFYGGKFLSGPSACSRAGFLDTFGFGLDFNIYHRATGSEVWSKIPSPPSPVKLNSISPPCAVAWSENSSVFARGDDDSLWVRSWIYNPFSGSNQIVDWKSWGGILTSGPAACHVTGSGTIDVFVRGEGNAIWHIQGNPQFDNKDSIIMENLFGEWDSDPSAVAMVAGLPEIPPPPPPTWNRASRKGIEMDSKTHAWNAGSINDLLLIRSDAPIGRILAASAHSGVWMIDEDGGDALCLSEDWDNPDVTCLASASEDDDNRQDYARVFAGCGREDALGGALYVSDDGIFNPWHRILPLLRGIGSIFEIAIWKEKNVIILACWGGIFWSFIPSRGGTYDWHSADWNSAGLATSNPPPCFSVTTGQDNTGTPVIFAGAYSEGIPGNRGIFVGSLTLIPRTSSFALLMSRVNTSSTFDSAKMRRVSLAICKNEPTTIYALSVGDAPAPPTVRIRGVPNALLRSKDGGANWTLCNADIVGRSDKITDYGDDSSGGIMHKISVDPWNSQVIAFGILHPFVSFDGGNEWERLNKWGGYIFDTHDDIHKILIVNDLTFYIASDGGIAKTNNRGSDFFSYYNKNLSNLLFYNTAGTGFYGRLFASYQFPNLVGGGLQDNANVYADLGYDGVWRKVIRVDGSGEGGDGGQMLSLRIGKFIHDQPFNDRGPRQGSWNPSERKIRIGEHIQVKNSSDEKGHVTASLPWTVMEIVNNPRYSKNQKQLMYAVGVTQEEVKNTTAKVFGLFANSDGSHMHWEPIIDPTWNLEKDHGVAAIGTGDGREVFFVTVKGGDVRMYRLTPSDGKVESLAGIPSGLPIDGTVTRLIVQSNLVVYAAYSIFGRSVAHPFGQGYLLKTTDGGKSWVQILGGFPSDVIYGMDEDWTTSPKTLYVSTDDKVYRSKDEGRSWQDFSQGLPRRPHCGDLRFVMYPDKTRHLFLGTWGQSLWNIALV